MIKDQGWIEIKEGERGGGGGGGGGGRGACTCSVNPCFPFQILSHSLGGKSDVKPERVSHVIHTGSFHVKSTQKNMTLTDFAESWFLHSLY